MYHFLGIVAEDDLRAGVFEPSYILCQSHGTSEKRSGWRVAKQNEDNPMRSMSKVLVTSPVGHEDMIEFLCGYNTRDHMHGDKRYTHEETMKYYPKGALFWFACNEYGEPEGYAILITRVPVKSFMGKGSGLQRLKESRRAPPLKVILSREPLCEVDPYSQIKPKLQQRR